MPGGGVIRAPFSWLAEWADLPESIGPRELSDALIRVGLEVEKVESGADGLSGLIVVGRVLSAEPEPQTNGKTINWCQVDVGEAEPRGIVCGAHNFAAGDLIVASLPGSVLNGGFAISARKTYGHVSDGMICSTRELGIGDDHRDTLGSQAPLDGILVLPESVAEPGTDALDVLGLREAVLEIAVTPDRAHCLSIRGLAREAAAALSVGFRDIAEQVVVPDADDAGYPVTVSDPVGCDRFSARAVTGLDPTAPSPDWMVRRLRGGGMRSISLAVDVTNYVMLETGQPLHAFDRAKVRGPLGVRRASAGEKLTTLDASVRTLDPADLVVTDDTGAIALAGVMGGESTEIDEHTGDVLLEAAHWQPVSISRTVRRHRLPSEAAKRFERGVDPAIAAVALQRCVDLLVEHGGAEPAPGFTVIGDGPPPDEIMLSVTLPGAVAGRPIDIDTVHSTLRTVGCRIAGTEPLIVSPPTWRPDLIDPADLVEEVVRLVGYDTIPPTLPTPPPGRGLTGGQTLRRAVSRAIAGAGYTEVLSYPFVAPSAYDVFGLSADDPRRCALTVLNPLSDAEPDLRTTLLPGLLTTLQRNAGRGQRDLAIFEMGLVYLGDPAAPVAPVPGVSGRPTPDEVEALYAAVPKQPRHLAAALSGNAERPGWWGDGRRESWADAVEAARTVARAARAELTVRTGDQPPWHPGRCAELLLGDVVVGYAGELHPRVIAALGLPERTSAMELDLDAFPFLVPAETPALSTYPPVLLDVALTVPEAVPAAEVAAALHDGAGDLLESMRLFDVYTDDRLREDGRKSLAYSLRLRAADRTLTAEEATAARGAALAAAATLGARLRD
ncbi:MAG: phenylalanine--tRNA ligase subunit beta [Jatrophihabitans sp.]